VEESDQVFRAKGTVVDVLRDAMFRVRTEEGHEVVARASGRMRLGRKIRILPGDTVDVEVSLYDPTKGRIVWRYT
jgi:translation initiation factor IF-1